MVRSRSVILISLAVAFPLSGTAQEGIAALPGEPPPSVTAAIFAPGLVSVGDQEYGVAVDPGWSEVYFTRLSGEQSVIMMTRRTGEIWAPAIPAPFSGDFDDSHPWIPSGGGWLYFMSRRPCPSAAQDLNVWVVERTSDGWTFPTSLGRPMTDQVVHAPSVSQNGNVYGTGLIRLRRVDGRYLPAERLSPHTTGSHPAIAPDESFVVFSARRTGGFGGKDLYVSFRQENGILSDAVNLGPGVNTRHGESSPTLSSDGRYLFFSRQGDIWWVDTAVIDAARSGSSG